MSDFVLLATDFGSKSAMCQFAKSAGCKVSYFKIYDAMCKIEYTWGCIRHLTLFKIYWTSINVKWEVMRM